jgi:phenylalanyl-tRNA synthetase alpha chain
VREMLENICKQALDSIAEAKQSNDLEAIRVKYLGKKGQLTQILRGMGKLSPEERPVMGQLANQVRGDIESALSSRVKEMEEMTLAKRLREETIDVTLPGKRPPLGGLHPLTTVLNQVTDVFLGMGFSVAEGPEVELDYYNFEALNMPRNHPARDTQDTFYINENILLRTHTSPTQIRVMEKQNPPIKIIVPGRVYRSDAVDATHSPIFHQLEGLVVDKISPWGI